MNKPCIVILGCNFAGLTTARYIHAVVKDEAEINMDFIINVKWWRITHSYNSLN